MARTRFLTRGKIQTRKSARTASAVSRPRRRLPLMRRIYPMRLLPILLAFTLAVPAPALPGVAYPTPTGTVWIEMASAGADKPREGVGRGVIEAPPERVFRALTDYGHWSEFMPFLQKSAARPKPAASVLGAKAMNLPAPGGKGHSRSASGSVRRTAPRAGPGR